MAITTRALAPIGDDAVALAARSCDRMTMRWSDAHYGHIAGAVADRLFELTEPAARQTAAARNPGEVNYWCVSAVTTSSGRNQ